MCLTYSSWTGDGRDFDGLRRLAVGQDTTCSSVNYTQLNVRNYTFFGIAARFFDKPKRCSVKYVSIYSLKSCVLHINCTTLMCFPAKFIV